MTDEIMTEEGFNEEASRAETDTDTEKCVEETVDASESTEATVEECESDCSVIDEDLKELREEFPELSKLDSITELTNPIRYAALRDLGLSPAEAYVLTSRRTQLYDNRSHLTASVPAAAKSPGSGMSARELEEARQIFGDISDSEIYKLYKKVTK